MKTVLAVSLMFGLLVPKIGFAFGDIPSGVDLPHPPYPQLALQQGDEGTVVLQIQFGPDGKVTSCKDFGSNASPFLQKCTVDFIEHHWVAKELAGKEYTVPFTYDAGTREIRKNLAPPNFLRKGDPDSVLKLRVTFSADGAVSRVDVVKSTGIESVDQKTADWIKSHWHTDDCKGRSLAVPLYFQALDGPKK
jgi:TonB family protein